MRRPLCCVCVAFVVTVFIYLQMNPAPAPTLCLEEGSNVTLQGRVVQKYVQKDELVVQLDHVSASQPKQKIDGRVLCYLELGERGDVPKAGSVIAVAGKVSGFGRARNPGEFDAQGYYQILGVAFRLYKAEVIAQGSSYSGCREYLYQIRRSLEGVFDRVGLTRRANSFFKRAALRIFLRFQVFISQCLAWGFITFCESSGYRSRCVRWCLSA